MPVHANRRVAFDFGPLLYDTGHAIIAQEGEYLSDKTLTVTDVKGWPNRHPKVIGRAPVKSELNFDLLALYGAAARASHLHQFSPTIASPEFQMMLRLMAPHIDGSDDFTIMTSASRLKDFVGSYFTGTVAAGIAYLTMVNEGYKWAAHFEGLSGGNPGTRKSPDFAFLGLHEGIALVEAKGTARTVSKLKSAVKKGYREQVEPHLGYLVEQIVATHGYCIGSWLRPGAPATVHIHYTEPKASAANISRGDDDERDMQRTVIRGNFGAVFSLAHSGELGAAIRREDSGVSADPLFFRFFWQGRSWLSTLGSLDGPWHFAPEPVFIEKLMNSDPFKVWPRATRLAFAVEERIGVLALREFLPPSEASFAGAVDAFEPGLFLDEGVQGEGRGVSEFPDGVVFPDGLALLDVGKASDHKLVRWDRDEERFFEVLSFPN